MEKHKTVGTGFAGSLIAGSLDRWIAGFGANKTGADGQYVEDSSSRCIALLGNRVH
jgi:hypothetical protein